EVDVIGVARVEQVAHGQRREVALGREGPDAGGGGRCARGRRGHGAARRGRKSARHRTLPFYAFPIATQGRRVTLPYYSLLNGRWAMGDGRWAMGDGRWAMGDETARLTPPYGSYLLLTEGSDRMLISVTEGDTVSKPNDLVQG